MYFGHPSTNLPVDISTRDVSSTFDRKISQSLVDIWTDILPDMAQDKL